MKKIINLNIRQKISMGFIVVLILFIITGISSILTLRTSRKIDDKISNISLPSITKLKELRIQIKNSEELTHKWIYIADINDKEKLKVLINEEYPLLESELVKLSSLWKNKENIELLDRLLESFTTVIENQKKIMANLYQMEDYSNDVKVDESISLLENTINPATKEILEKITSLIDSEDKIANDFKEDKIRSFNFLSIVIIISVFMVSATCILILFTLPIMISNPINKLKDFILELAKGELPEKLEVKINDEVGQMTEAVNLLNENLKSTRDFALEVGKGQFDTTINIFNNQGTLGRALSGMKDSLKEVAIEQENQRQIEVQRNWVASGIAKFGEILRKNQQNLQELGHEVISNLIKYMEANQGGLFIINDEDPNDVYIELVAMFAYNRRKHLEKRINIGEGLLGTCYLEKQTTYITKIPQGYISITSGLGDALPDALLIVPLKLNEEVFGLIEIATFGKFEPHQIEFIEKVGEIIASTLSSAKINIKTTELLEKSQKNTEQLGAQEEELRQNMEELHATQEAMQRKEISLQETIRKQEEEINRLNILLKTGA